MALPGETAGSAVAKRNRSETVSGGAGKDGSSLLIFCRGAAYGAPRGSGRLLYPGAAGSAVLTTRLTPVREQTDSPAMGALPWVAAEEAGNLLLEKAVAGDSKDVRRLAEFAVAHCSPLAHRETPVAKSCLRRSVSKLWREQT